MKEQAIRSVARLDTMKLLPDFNFRPFQKLLHISVNRRQFWRKFDTVIGDVEAEFRDLIFIV